MSSAPSWLAGGIGGAVVQTDGWIGGNGGVVQTGCTVGSIDILVGSAAVAKEVVRSRNSISMHLGEIVATTRTVGHLSKSTEVMKLVNNLMKAPEVAATMQEFSKEMTKAGVMEEMVNDAVDSALDNEDMEEEIEEEVDKVLSAIAGETASQLPEAARKQKEKVTQPSTSEPVERTAIAESVDDDEDELEKIRERLAKVRS